MRRKDREITSMTKILEIIEKCDVCRIAFHDSPFPYIVPMNFGISTTDDQITLYFHCANEGKKLDLIKQNPSVCFEMDCAHQLFTDDVSMNCSMAYESVIGYGKVEIVPETEKLEALNLLMAHYHKEDFQFNQKVIPMTTVFKLTVETMTAKHRLLKNHHSVSKGQGNTHE